MKVYEKRHGQSEQAIVRFNTTVRGLPARLVLQWQAKGLVRSKADALRQALLALAKEFSSLEKELEKHRGEADFEENVHNHSYRERT